MHIGVTNNVKHTTHKSFEYFFLIACQFKIICYICRK